MLQQKCLLVTVISLEKKRLDNLMNDLEKLERLKYIFPKNTGSDLACVLKANVVGQCHAKERVLGKFLEADYILDAKGPRASFLMLGDSGLGKSYMASVIAEGLGHKNSFFELDMASLTHEQQTAELNGSEPSYKNAAPGRLTNYIRNNPEATILLKNIDKAHPALIRIVSGILSDGCLLDKFGFYEDNDPENEEIAERTVDFSQAIVLMTCSGLEPFWDSSSFSDSFERENEKIYEMAHGALSQLESYERNSKSFDQEFLDAVGLSGLVIFRRLKIEQYCEIAQRRYEQLARSLNKSHGLKIEVPSEEIMRVATLCSAPDIKAGRVESNIFEMFIKPIIQVLSEGTRLSSVAMKLEDQSLQDLKDLSDKLGSSPVDYVFKKGIRVWSGLNKEIIDDNHLCLTINSVSSGKNISISDSGSSGSVNFQIPDLRFSDIAGHIHIKEKLEEVVGLLFAPEDLSRYGVKPPKGMLLYGVPGTGKTMLAKALAAEADLPFINVSGTELLDSGFCREVFSRARRYAPSIVFIDELDVLGNRERKGHTLAINQLLTEIDGFDTDMSDPVFVIAATNHPGSIDSALLRSGRIDLHYEVPPLDREARRYFLQRFEDLPFDRDFDYELLLKLSSGMSGAEFEQVRRELVMLKLTSKSETMAFQTLLELLNQKQFGHKKDLSMTIADRNLLAFHEAGHAVVSAVLNPEVDIQFVTISPRGDSMGLVRLDASSENNHVRRTKNEMLELMAVALAGRLSERKVDPDYQDCAGASADLAKTTRLAEVAITAYGLDEEFGNLSLAHVESDSLKESFAPLVMERIRDWVKQAEVICNSTLERYWKAVEKLAILLLDKELVSGEEVFQIIRELRH